MVQLSIHSGYALIFGKALGPNDGAWGRSKKPNDMLSKHLVESQQITGTRNPQEKLTGMAKKAIHPFGKNIIGTNAKFVLSTGGLPPVRDVHAPTADTPPYLKLARPFELELFGVLPKHAQGGEVFHTPVEAKGVVKNDIPPHASLPSTSRQGTRSMTPFLEPLTSGRARCVPLRPPTHPPTDGREKW